MIMLDSQVEGRGEFFQRGLELSVNSGNIE